MVNQQGPFISNFLTFTRLIVRDSLENRTLESASEQSALLYSSLTIKFQNCSSSILLFQLNDRSVLFTIMATDLNYLTSLSKTDIKNNCITRFCGFEFIWHQKQNFGYRVIAFYWFHLHYKDDASFMNRNRFQMIDYFQSKTSSSSIKFERSRHGSLDTRKIGLGIKFLFWKVNSLGMDTRL